MSGARQVSGRSRQLSRDRPHGAPRPGSGGRARSRDNSDFRVQEGLRTPERRRAGRARRSWKARTSSCRGSSTHGMIDWIRAPGHRRYRVPRSSRPWPLGGNLGLPRPELTGSDRLPEPRLGADLRAVPSRLRRATMAWRAPPRRRDSGTPNLIAADAENGTIAVAVAATEATSWKDSSRRCSTTRWGPAELKWNPAMRTAD